MRENSIDFNKVTSLKEDFSLALENKKYQEANEILDQIDNIFLKVSGKSFRSSLTNESRERLNKFLNNSGEIK